MRCHICDRPLTNPKKHPETDKYEPCSTCIHASAEVVFDSEDISVPLTDDDLSLLEAIEESPIDI